MKKLLLFFTVMLFGLSFSFGQKTVTGMVVDNDGLPMIGASILVQGTTTGTVTDIDGKFSLLVPEGQNVLVVTYTGYLSQNVTIGDQNNFEVTLVPDSQLLEEVVVVGYGSLTRQQIAGSVGSVKSEDVRDIQNSNVVQGLQGKIAGVQIINQNGQPGATPSVRFRGIGSINASNAPLYVVDGIPYNGNINAISTQDIESINFLKDASSNALYGNRGANGVIVITTKKAKENGIKVNLDTKIGVASRGVPEYDIIKDPGEYYEVWHERIKLGLISSGVDPADAAATATAELIDGGEYSLGYNAFDVAGNELVGVDGTLNPSASLLYYDNWEEELFSNETRSETFLSLSAKSDQLAGRFSLGYMDDKGFALNSGFKRISARAAVDYDYNEHLSVGANINYANTDQDAPLQNVGSSTYSNLFSWARNVAPIYPVYGRDENGDIITDSNGESLYDFGTSDDNIPGVRPYGAFNNPVATSILDIDNNKIDNFSGRMYGKVNFLNNFNFTYNFSADLTNGNFLTLATPIGGDAKGVNGRLTVGSDRGITLGHQQLLTWVKELADGHNLSILVGHESFQYKFNSQSTQKTNLVVPDLPVLDNATSFQYGRSSRGEYTVEGYLSRVNYDYQNKYFINASFRRDGSSVFHPDNRQGNFYGVGGAWSIHNEEFFNKNGLINTLQIRGSYGQQGNDAITYDGGGRNYKAYENQYDVVNSGGGNAGIQFFALGNPDLEWEKSTNINAGFELSLLNNRLFLETEYFIRKVEGLLFHNPLPLSSGPPSFPENIGDMENKGIELSLGANLIDSDNFKWDISINSTHFKNEITALPDSTIDDGRFQLEVGRSRYDFYMREYAGIEAETGEAMWYIDEFDDDGNPTGNRVTTTVHADADEYFLDKQATPDFYGGFETRIEVYGVSLSAGFSYQLGGYGYDGVYQTILGPSPDIGQNYHRDVLDSWTPDNTGSSIPRMDVVDPDNGNTSDFYLIDASYLSLNNLTLSYNLPENLLSKYGIDQVRIYASADNVKLWSKRKGYDPRLSVVGTASNEYSVVRRVSMGLNLTF